MVYDAVRSFLLAYLGWGQVNVIKTGLFAKQIVLTLIDIKNTFLVTRAFGLIY